MELGLGLRLLHHIDARVREGRGAFGSDQDEVVRVEPFDEFRGAA